MSKIFDARLADWKEQIDAELKAILDKLDYSDGFKEILEYALFPGGKRLRPVLMLEWHSIFSAPDEYALRYACGIEILHSYSLIHDDMPCIFAEANRPYIKSTARVKHCSRATRFSTSLTGC